MATSFDTKENGIAVSPFSRGIKLSSFKQVKPAYPTLAVQARIQGTVVLQAVIAKDGTVEDLRVVSGHPLLVQAALDAVRLWRYKPYLLNEQPVEVDTQINVNFTLGSR
jgi:periplasmic protein TonB